MDTAAIKEHFATFTLVASRPEAFGDIYNELDGVLPDGKLAKGHFLADLILATRPYTERGVAK